MSLCFSYLSVKMCETESKNWVKTFLFPGETACYNSCVNFLFFFYFLFFQSEQIFLAEKKKFFSMCETKWHFLEECFFRIFPFFHVKKMFQNFIYLFIYFFFHFFCLWKPVKPVKEKFFSGGFIFHVWISENVHTRVKEYNFKTAFFSNFW